MSQEMIYVVWQALLCASYKAQSLISVSSYHNVLNYEVLMEIIQYFHFISQRRKLKTKKVWLHDITQIVANMTQQVILFSYKM